MKSRKAFEVIKRRQSLKRVHHEGKDMYFGKSGMFMVKDPALAKDLQQQIGQDAKDRDDVLVVPIDDHKPDGISQDFFSLQRLGNWKDRIDWSK